MEYILVANTLKVKRSSVQGKVPLTTDLDLGELAVNTYDGKLFLKKNVGGTETIVDVTVGADAATILTLLKTVDGSGSGLDADLVEGMHAVSTNTVNSIVARDASGNFSAGTITAALSGNASTTTKLATARTISITGDVTGSVSFDGSADASITATIAANSVALGTDTTGNYVADVTAGSYITKSGTAGEGWSPTIAVDATSANTASKVVARDASGNFSAGTITATLSGNASTVTNGIYTTGSYADPAWITSINYSKLTGTIPTWNQNTTGSAAKWTTARTLSFTGDATGSGSVDGSANVATALTLANSGVTAGTYTKITVDAKGRATSGTTLTASDIPSLDASKITSGVFDAARLPSYVDDVLEYTNLASFPTTGETGKIYVDLATNKTYRWSGTVYVYITSGAVDSVAGKTGVVTLTNSDVGLGNVENKSSATIRSELTSTNVTTALGYTPYNSTNPNGYTTNTGTVTSVAAGSYLTGGTITTSGTLAVDATSANTASKVVARDASGNFSAGTITAALSGNASTATTLQTARTLTIGSTGKTFNGSANVSWSHSELGTTRNFGYVTVQGVVGSNLTCTTDQFITWLTNLGAFSQTASVMKCTWDYAGNNDISDTGFGTLEMAGCVIETFGDTGSYIVRVTSPSTGTGANGVHEYVNHGANYSPGWRRVYTSDLNGNITGSSSSCTGNAATATNLTSTRSNWGTNGTISAVVGQLAWKNYNNGRTIFDASAGTSPDGTAVNNTNADIAWTGTYPTLMGWNGTSTYGVRVDSARVADSATSATTATYLTTTQLNARVTGQTNSLAMTASDSTNLGSFVCRASGTGDANLAGMTFWNDAYAIKMGIRADGYIGIGGWSRAAWSWYSDPSGNMVAAGNVTAYSDPRLKENFAKVENPLEILSKLDGGTFNWKRGYSHTECKAGSRDYGILADQVELVMPEIVTESIEIDGEKYKTVAYEKLIPVLIEAIKELKAEIDLLKSVK